MSEIFKSLIWDSLVSLALKQLFKAIPFLGWGPIGAIVSWFAFKFANMIFDHVEMFINFQLIAFKNEKLAKEYGAAAVTLKEIGESKGIESEEFKNARQAHKESLARLIKFGD